MHPQTAFCLPPSYVSNLFQMVSFPRLASMKQKHPFAQRFGALSQILSPAKLDKHSTNLMMEKKNYWWQNNHGLKPHNRCLEEIMHEIQKKTILTVDTDLFDCKVDTFFTSIHAQPNKIYFEII